MDFGELLLRSHELWLHRTELLTHYQSRFQHILVDEFQDTNTVQYAWLQVLASNTDRRIIQDERVPSTDKIVSRFEPHTDLLPTEDNRGSVHFTDAL